MLLRTAHDCDSRQLGTGDAYRFRRQLRYNGFQRPTDICTKRAGRATIARSQYVWDGAHNVLSRTDADGSVTSLDTTVAKQLMCLFSTDSSLLRIVRSGATGVSF